MALFLCAGDNFYTKENEFVRAKKLMIEFN